MRNLENPKAIYFKGFLFLLGGVVSSGVILLETRSLQIAALLCIAIWCFCRLYYFMFYCIEHYVDGQYRFSGIWPFIRYVKKRG